MSKISKKLEITTLPFISSLSGVFGQVTWGLSMEDFQVGPGMYDIRDIEGATSRAAMTCAQVKNRPITLIEIDNLQDASKVKSKAIQQLGRFSYMITLNPPSNGLYIFLRARVGGERDIPSILQDIRKIIKVEVHPTYTNLN